MSGHQVVLYSVSEHGLQSSTCVAHIAISIDKVADKAYVAVAPNNHGLQKESQPHHSHQAELPRIAPDDNVGYTLTVSTEETHRSTNDPIAITVYTALTHLDKRNTYLRMLFIDYSSPFSTIVPSKLITKFTALGQNSSLCNWVLDFLTGRPPVGEGRQHYLLDTDPQHVGPTRVRPQSPPVLPVNPRLCGFTQFQLHHQVC